MSFVRAQPDSPAPYVNLVAAEASSVTEACNALEAW